MATIRATCPGCGDVELTTSQVQVLMCSTTSAVSYAFRCPDCQLMISKATESRVVDVLVSAGVQLRVWQLPAELDEPHDGDPLTWDDLLEFHFALSEDGWFERATAGVVRRDAR
ncbi:MAG TPA: hypothetical protein VFP54_09590 [Acidimicrobiales bacterium]|nr:hypothetical protein [Acidimicrobiales bacterium]